MLIGYARGSTVEQNLGLQRDALGQAGCEEIIEEAGSGRHRDRPGLARVLDKLRRGDTHVHPRGVEARPPGAPGGVTIGARSGRGGPLLLPRHGLAGPDGA